MNKLVSTLNVQDRIYRIRGQQVMIDHDLAELYGVPTKRLNEQVRRNLKRFPPDFMFQLSPQEVSLLRSHFATSKIRRGGRRYSPYAFTELGVAMLSTVLNSEKAIQVNIAIMRAFVRLRHAMLASRDIARRVEKLEGKVSVHDTDIRLILDDIRQLQSRSLPRGPIPPTLI
jgi:hypothetical protein